MPVRGERLGSSRGDLVRAACLIAALRDAGHEVEVVEATRGGAALAVAGYRSVARRILPRRVALVLRDLGRVLHARAHARRVAEACVRQRAELLIETQVHFAGSGALAARSAGVLLVLDDCSPSSEESALGCGLPRLAARVLRVQALTARALVVPSAALAAALAAEGLPAARIRIVPNGVDLAEHDAARARRAEIRASVGLRDELAVVFAGSFQPWHQAVLLPRAMALVGRPGLALVLMGDGPGHAECVREALASGLRVIDMGAVPHARVAELLAACDVGALPGTNDHGQPMKLVEYAAARLPSVAPDLPIVREVLTDGRTGLLFRPGNAEALAQALAALLADSELRRRLGDVAHAESALPATWARRAAELLDAAKPAADPAAT